ncbi:hypothetical protein AX14_008147 [Amanita brunnescens Koide BX004]|nr:hypothetical protein AX14_008147 [Amanita brunnescens Koide BX004]
MILLQILDEGSSTSKAIDATPNIIVVFLSGTLSSNKSLILLPTNIAHSYDLLLSPDHGGPPYVPPLICKPRTDFKPSWTRKESIFHLGRRTTNRGLGRSSC